MQFQTSPKLKLQWMPQNPKLYFSIQLVLVEKIPHTHPQPHYSQLFPYHFFLLCSSHQPVNHAFDQEPRACSYMRIYIYNIPAPAKDLRYLVVMQPQCVVSQVTYRYIFLIVLWRNDWYLDTTDAEYAVHHTLGFV